MTWRDVLVGLHILAPGITVSEARKEAMASLSAAVARHDDVVGRVSRSAEVRAMMTRHDPDREDAQRAERTRIDAVEALLKGMDQR